MSAVVSGCGQYRYMLTRQCVGAGSTAIVMVNPSTADAAQNDPTIRKLIGFGCRNRWGKLLVGNLFAYRATDVRELGACEDPVGSDNDAWLRTIFAQADRVICAWGPLAKQPKVHRGRWQRVVALAGDTPLFVIGDLTKDGQPRHPLMPAYETPILPWEPLV